MIWILDTFFHKILRKDIFCTIYNSLCHCNSIYYLKIWLFTNFANLFS